MIELRRSEPHQKSLGEIAAFLGIRVDEASSSTLVLHALAPPPPMMDEEDDPYNTSAAVIFESEVKHIVDNLVLSIPSYERNYNPTTGNFSEVKFFGAVNVLCALLFKGGEAAKEMLLRIHVKNSGNNSSVGFGIFITKYIERWSNP